jgi:hypothetical protein
VSLRLATDGPCFVRPYKPDKGGVDFLGMRQVNLDMMANCLPGFNNVTLYVRPFSVVSWLYWKFHQLSERTGALRVTNKELRVWKEKVETLFTWGHKLEGVSGIPGTDAKPPGSGAVPLDFTAWKRSAVNTSLMAAVQYGPAAKNIDGLGFLEPLGGSFFQTVNNGVALAKALDVNLRDFGLLEELGHAKATAEDASELYPAWSILEPSKREQEIFRLAFYDPETIGEQTPLGRRSTTLQLAIEILMSAPKPLSTDEVRILMFRGRRGSKRTNSVDPKLKHMWLRWVVLQIRQCQRLAMEGLLSWFENLLVGGSQDTDAVVQETLKVIEEHKEIFPLYSPGRALKLIQRKIPSLDEALQQSEFEPDLDPFRLMGEIRQAVSNQSERLAPYCLRSTFLCAAFALLLQSEASVKPEIERGSSDRLSLAFWTDTLLRWSALGLEEFLRHFFEMLILSQHFAVAARRFDGQTQRLRISIEEDGLEFLADKPLVPSVTPDRLYTALSLMLDCGLINWGDSQEGYVAK